LVQGLRFIQDLWSGTLSQDVLASPASRQGLVDLICHRISATLMRWQVSMNST
jgi:hypothetical protein